MGANESADLLLRHRLTVAEYHLMGQVGVLAPDARVELIEGEIVDMAPIGTKHGSAVKRLTQLLTAALGTRAIVSVQDPLRLDQYSEPEPDLMVLRPREDFYAIDHPGPADVLLLIEVSATSARYDREIKLPLYARHGVPEVWVLDLDAGVFRTCSRPLDGEYSQVEETATPGLRAPIAMPEVVIDLAPLLR